MDEYQPEELERTGYAPLIGEMQKIAYATNQPDDSSSYQRWHEIALYKTRRGNLVLHVCWRANWHEETDHCTALVLPDDPNWKHDVSFALANYDPVAHLMGFPDQAQFRGRQQKLKAQITSRWQALVAKFLGLAGIGEEV